MHGIVDDDMDIQQAYEELIQRHIDDGHLRYPEFKEAFLRIPIEELFSTKDLKRFIGEDRPVVAYEQGDYFRTITAPHMISIFLSMLELNSRDKILIVGAKGGFLEAVLANICEFVFIIEAHQGVADLTMSNLRKLGIRNVKMKTGNPCLGCAEVAPFSKVLFTGAVTEVPEECFSQLEDYGLLVAPINERFPASPEEEVPQQVVQYYKTGSQIIPESYGAVIFQQLYTPVSAQGIKVSPRPSKRAEKVRAKQESFDEYFRGLPKIIIESVAFDSPDAKKATLDIDAPNYCLMIELRNGERKSVRIKIQTVVPSMKSEETTPLLPIPPNSNLKEPILLANPKKEGTHNIKINILDDQGFRVANLMCDVHIKKSFFKKVVEVILSGVPLISSVLRG